MDDREIIHWDKRLADQVKRGWDNYKHLHLNLSTARLDQSYLIAGEFLYVEDSYSADSVAKVRLNRKNNDSLDLEKFVKIETVFIEIFITNDALEDEWLDLVFGINFNYYKEREYVAPDDPQQFQAYPCMILTKPAPGNVGAGFAVCHRVLIRAHTGNAGTIWIDFGPPAVVDDCYELTPGDAISVPLTNTNLISGWFVNGGDRATIVYEVEV